MYLLHIRKINVCAYDNVKTRNEEREEGEITEFRTTVKIQSITFCCVFNY